MTTLGRVKSAGEAVEQFKSFDRTSREVARGFAKDLQLVVDLDKNQITCVDEKSGAMSGKSLSLAGTGAILQELLVAKRSYSSGQVTIPCSRLGYTPTYAILVRGPTAKQWFVVMGPTGQIAEVSNESEAASVLSLSSVSNGRL
jgi:hypothetical protein